MNLRQILLVGLLAACAAGMSLFAARFDQLWLVVAALAAAFVGGGMLLHKKSSEALRELGLLREHLETTRQQAGALARHTRELRDAFVQNNIGQASPAALEGMTKSADFAVLSALVRDVADSVAELDRRSEATERELAELRRARAGNPAPTSQAGWVAPSRASVPSRPDMPSARSMANALRPDLREIPAAPDIAATYEAPRQVRQLVASAIAADRFDLFLQRIVGLPQRKTRAYEVTLRPDGGDLGIANSDIRAAVEAVGHQLAFDRRLMIQAVRLARVFEQRERDVLLFVDISQRYLMSEAAFDELGALIADAPMAPQRIILSLPQRFFKKAVAFEHEALRNLSEMGFRFAMRDVEELDFDLPRLAQSGVRWMRVDGPMLVEALNSTETVMDVASADFIALLARRKIALIADRVNSDENVAELIDFNVEFAHGLAFAPPQAVRPDVLEGQPQAQAAAPVSPRHAEAAPAGERRGLRDLARRA